MVLTLGGITWCVMKCEWAGSIYLEKRKPELPQRLAEKFEGVIWKGF